MRYKEIFAIYMAALLQGIVMVAFPAASAIFTSEQGFAFSNQQYGALFIPQAVLSILFSLLSFKVGEKFGFKSVLLVGLLANIFSMVLLFSSASLMHSSLIAYCVLLAATGCLGIGFGLTVPCLNTFASFFFPRKIDTAILVLNALLGLGTALAPLLIALFIQIWSWWGLPLTLFLSLLALFTFTLFLPLGEANKAGESPSHKNAFYSFTFWIFALFAFLYGIVETANGNWAVVYMAKDLGTDPSRASLALASFWGMVTFGRVFFAVFGKVIPERLVLLFLPFIILIAFLFVSFLGHGESLLAVLGFGLAGFGCSALLPLSISFGTKALPTIKTAVAGCLVAFYLMGYGVAAFGGGVIGSLTAVFQICALISLLLGVLAFVIIRLNLSHKKDH